MNDLLVIVPSRGRPANIARLIGASLATANADTHLLVCLDDDDPTLSDYPPANSFTRIRVGPRLRLGPTLNATAVEEAGNYRHLAFLGDDHNPVTVGWDQTIIDTLDAMGTGIVYGNDLLQGERLPTAVFMTANIVQTLGWMCPPGLVHLFLDDAWKALGERAGCLRYLPDVIIEHLHPIAAKAEFDAGYVECNAPDMWAHDETIYKQWVAGGLDADAAKVRRLVEALV